MSIAASNSPRSTVLSGDSAALDAIRASLESQSIFCRRVQVDYASHSPQMDAPRPVPLDMDGRALTAEYWAANLRAPVQFSQAVAALLAAGETCFLEISPLPILVSSMQEISQHAGRKAIVVGSLRREQVEKRDS